MINELSQKNKKGFTLAEALITLVIIGVIAALTIPAILVNTEQHEYKSALKKALSALNQVIEMNIALEGYGPLESKTMTVANDGDEDQLFNLFRRRMNVISTSTTYNWGNTSNMAFFTADGMRYEFPREAKMWSGYAEATFNTANGECATPGGNIQNDAGEPKNDPCLIIVDVNGQRRPNPRKVTGSYKVPSPTGRSKILDVFPIIITDKAAYPFGVVAQRAMFQHD